MAPPTAGATAYLINHIVLPPDLPQANDYDVAHEQSLLSITAQALQDLRSHVAHKEEKAVAFAAATIRSLIRNRDNNGYIKEAELQASLDEMLRGTSAGVIALEIKAQNAGLLIRRDSANIVFESFELSPTNKASMECKGRLIRTFPGLASKVSVSKMREKGLTQALALTLARMSIQSVADFQPSNRANTGHPGLVSDFLMNVIAAVGGPADAIRITKHTRDEVLSKSAHLPWRRSPLWLLARVALQLVFTLETSSRSTSSELYKASIILVLSRLLGLAKDKWQTIGTDSMRALSSKTIRRLRKFENLADSDALSPNWQERVRSNLVDVHKHLDAKWHEAVERGHQNIDGANLSRLRPAEDLDVTLPTLNEFLRAAAPSPSVAPHAFRATFDYPVFPADKVPDIHHQADENQIYRLVATETWVEKHLATWAESHKEVLSSCGDLRRLMQAYYASACGVYAGNPACMSIMYLTLCDIWVQCDILACHEYPLLHKYDPVVPLDELQSLSLPLKSQMERLHKIETHVRLRKTAATKNYPSIYRDFGDTFSFAVKYFDSEQGESLRLLLAELERVAGEAYRKKLDELDELKRQHRNLMEQYDNSDCDFEVTMAEDEYGDEGMFCRHSRRF